MGAMGKIEHVEGLTVRYCSHGGYRLKEPSAILQSVNQKHLLP